MAISDKLTYLNTTKGKIKDAINLTNANILSEDTFRSYAEKLKLGLVDIINNGIEDLYDSFPKTTGTGTEIALNDTYEAPMEIGLNGNTHQDSYTGKNLFDNVYGQNMNVYTKNIVANNPLGSVSCYPINLLPNTQYTLTVNMNGYEKINTWISGLCFEDGRVISLLQYGTMADVTTTTFTTDSTGIVYVGHRYGYDPDRLKLFLQTAKIQIEKGPTATDIEPFVGGSPSPSPDYPQQIEVVTGDNTINVHGKNLFDKNNANIRLGRRMGLNGISIVDNDYFISDYIEIKPSTQYSVNYTMSVYTRIAYYDKDKIFISDNSSLATFTTPSNAKYLILGNLQTELNNVQLEEGSTATEYQSYQSKDYEISLGNIELCKIGDYQDYIYKENNKWYKHSEIGKVVLDGSENWTMNANQTYFLYTNNIFPMSSSGSAIYPMYSTHFISNKFDLIYNGSIDYGIAFAYNARRIVIRNKDMATAEAIKTWLSTHNTIVYYVLETPTNDEITDTDLINQLEELKNAKSVDDKTFISQTNEQLPFILDVSALSKN